MILVSTSNLILTSWNFSQAIENSYFNESKLYATVSKFQVFNIKFDVETNIMHNLF